MPARAIVNVDLNDDKFKAFQASFNKFNDQLSKLPDAWKKVNAVQGEQEKGFQSIAAAMMAQLELLRRYRCPQAQGYLLGMPQPSEQVARLLAGPPIATVA